MVPHSRSPFRNIRMFAEASTASLTRLADTCQWRHVLPGEVLLDSRKGREVTSVLLVASGLGRQSRRLPGGRELGLSWLIPGDVAGELEAVDRGPLLADVTAMTDMEVGLVPINVYREILRNDPAMMQAQLAEMAVRLRRCAETAYELASCDARTRLCRELLRHATRTRGRESLMAYRMRHEDWATMIGAQRHVVSGLLKDLERRGIFHRTGDNSLRLDTEALLALVQPATRIRPPPQALRERSAPPQTETVQK